MNLFTMKIPTRTAESTLRKVSHATSRRLERTKDTQLKFCLKSLKSQINNLIQIQKYAV